VKKENIKIIPSAWLEQTGRRLDCGPYLSGGLEAKILLNKLSVRKDPLHSLTAKGSHGIFHAGREGRTWVEDPAFGVPFLSSSDVLQADLSSAPLISRRIVSRNPLFLIGPRWTLITRSGTVGRMLYSRTDMDGFACSEHVLRVVPDESKVPAGYLYSFLASRYGLPIVVGGTYGSIIQHIEPAHVAELPVPRFGDPIESEAHRLVQEAERLRCQYQRQICEATGLLFASVGLKDIAPADWHADDPDVGFTRKLPTAASLRALNFNPRFQHLSDRICSRPHRRLVELCKPGTLRRGGRYKRIDADPEYAYQLIGQKEIFWLRPEGRWIAKRSVGEDVLVEAGTTLVAAQGTLGESELYCRSEFVWGPLVERAYSEHLLRVISEEVLMPRGCLFAFMRSESAFRLLRSTSMGTKLQDHHPTFLRQLPVPYPEKKIQDEIHNLVVDAYEKRHRSVAVEDEATSLIERAVEEGG